ncbi:MAG: NAD(P)/FAD-dependent oxidoreductase [Lawsonibacter sp.]|nr:NAD(P)/FAD-dependent oxidoreductase [Lawsonibacter sp.]
MEHFDLVIIGSGAGLMVMEAALEKGLRCALIEKAKIGGTCLTKGCIPSKMLVYPADFIREAEEVKRVGIQIERPKIDWELISKRMWKQIHFHQTIEDRLMGIQNLVLYKGSGTFTGPNSMVITCEGKADEVISGDKFLIAAGARTFVPSVEGLEEAGYVTSETFFGEKFPQKPWESLAIIGGGAISAEFAHIFSAFGTKVTIIVRSGGILNKEEPEIAQLVSRQFVKNGIDLLTNSALVSVRAEGGTKYITTENSETKSRTVVECEEIFVASGVRSNADTLSLERAGVETDKNGWILTNSYLETSREHIWALGDINGKYQFRHKANYEAQILSQNLFSGGEKRDVRYDAVPWAIFTHPQVAHLGMTEKEVQKKRIPYRTAENHYSEVVGGIAMGYRTGGEDNGFVKVILGEDKKILGVHIVGPQAAILLQPFVYLMNAGYQCQKAKQLLTAQELEDLRILCPNLGTYAPINNSMVIHPSLNELTAWVFEKFDLPE